MSIDANWLAFCDALERRIGAQEADIWTRTGALRAEYVNGSAVRLRAENRYSYEWIRDNLMPQIVEAWGEVYGQAIDVQLTWDGAQAEPEAPSRNKGGRPSGLNREMTFENFVVGKCNDFAHGVASAVAEAPGNAYNPLFVYGASGLGKSHLVQAIGNRVEKRLGGGVLYLSGQQFLEQMVTAFQNNAVAPFREGFRRDIDLLIIDDIQVIAGRERTEEEIFLLFEHMLGGKKQIVLAADQPPQEIGKLTPRLRTRFAAGLIADVQPPDVETMMAILGQKARLLRLELPSDVQYLIAQRARNSVREVEGVLNRLNAMHAFYGRPITMAFVQEKLSTLLPPEAPPPSPDAIIKKVAENYHILPNDIKGDRRPANIARPRQLAMYLCRSVANLSFPEIGRVFGRDNSTVQYACKKVGIEAKKDPNLRAELDHLEKIVRGR
ncbi:MAG: chromosomal replication initiator protein DnaA [Deltaproteobacteria bacterium]|nr:chromosomal replication initiator protein DnaA [Deltaproteobacteria bacterium]